MVGCLGIVDSCPSACENSFKKCVKDSNQSTGLKKFKKCLSDISELEGCEEKPCAPTLEMLRLSEDPVVSLSQGKFGTSSSLPVDKITRPLCEEEFGTFDDVPINKCKPKNGKFADGNIANCPATGPTTDPVTSKPTIVSTGNPTPDPALNPNPVTSKPTIVSTGNDPTPDPALNPNPGFCGSKCAEEWPKCVNFGNNSCESCQNELQNPSSILVNAGNCVVGCEPTDEMMMICKKTEECQDDENFRFTSKKKKKKKCSKLKLKHCKKWDKNSGMLVQNHCPKMCGYCENSKRCKDEKKDKYKCKKVPKKKSCTDKIKKRLVSENCRESCSFCEISE